jgi:hypothetical protein
VEKLAFRCEDLGVQKLVGAKRKSRPDGRLDGLRGFCGFLKRVVIK